MSSLGSARIEIGDAWSARLRRFQLSLGLLLERRAVLFLSVDALLILFCLVLAVSGEPTAVYRVVFMTPLFLLVIPALADSVALERRAGSLDLALTAPGARFYFLRRVGSLLAIVVVQTWILLLLDRYLLGTRLHPVWLQMFQALSVTLFVGGAVLFWATRLTTTGAVAFATIATFLAFGKWTFGNPAAHPIDQATGRYIYASEAYLAFGRDNFVLLSAAVILALYADRRITRPESILD